MTGRLPSIGASLTPVGLCPSHCFVHTARRSALGKRVSLRARVARFILNRADLLVAIIRIVVAMKNLFSS